MAERPEDVDGAFAEDDEIVEVDLDTAAAAEEVDDDEVEATVAAVTGVFDDDPVVGDDDGEDLADALDGIRDGEFVCRRCHLARRDTQLADEKAMLCRDCA